jgi:hypothetical protein
MNETEVAAGIAAGLIPSPTRFGNSAMVAMRISGTGAADRPSINERVWRDPAAWLSEEALARVSGLPVVLDHPDGAALDATEYEARSVGSILFPYVAGRDGVQNGEGPDLWGVARLFVDDDMLAQISDRSTSPGVIFTKADNNQKITLSDGTECLVESSPTLIDHVAIIMSGDGAAASAGVWDKGSETERGIRFDSKENTHMPTDEEMAADKARKDTEEQARKDAEGGNIDKVMKHLDAISARLDALEKRGDASETEEEKAKREAADRADRARKDGRADVDHGTTDRPASRNATDAAKEREENSARTDAQCRADAVAGAFGQRAPAPMMGESSLGYRKRLARQFQRHSVFKDANLDVIAADAATFAGVETQIYADALVASKTPEVAAGHRMARTRTTESGHKITEWHGETIFKSLAAPSMRATAFLTSQNRAN